MSDSLEQDVKKYDLFCAGTKATICHKLRFDMLFCGFVN